jgi:c-di-GMP-binding flagellar brake protein YcgR
MTEKGKSIQTYIHFFAVGLDSGFSFGQILLLGRVGKETGLEDLAELYWSVGALDSCTAEIVRRAKFTGNENDANTQKLLSMLYSYRTKIALEQSQKRIGVESSRDIVAGQRIRVLLRGIGVFSSKIVRSTQKDLIIDYPYNPKISATSIDWKGKVLSIYFWRKDDAGYVFDTAVLPDQFSDKGSLHLAHAAKLVRSQKRKSIRAKCSIYAQLYLFKPGMEPDTALEPEPGMKCLLEDVSEDGAMIVIGGKAVKDMKIKLQFMVLDVLIIMAGTVRAVEYNKETNQSRIHFECGTLNPRMRNAVLTFVYNVLPEEEKEELDAIRLTEEDGQSEESQPPSSDLGSVEYKPDLPDFAQR